MYLKWTEEKKRETPKKEKENYKRLSRSANITTTTAAAPRRSKINGRLPPEEPAGASPNPEPDTHFRQNAAVDPGVFRRRRGLVRLNLPYPPPKKAENERRQGKKKKKMGEMGENLWKKNLKNTQREDVKLGSGSW